MWIYGAGGFGRETHEACLAAGLDVEGFADDALAGTRLRDLDVVAGTDLAARSGRQFVVAIADPAIRRRIHGELVDAGLAPVTVVDPRAVVSERSELGPGSIALATSYVSCDVSLGAAAQLNYGCSVGHDTVAGDAFTVLPGGRVGGTCSAGDGVFIGAGAVVTQGLRLGADAVVGAGAVVLDDVEPGSTVVGVPARPLIR